MDSSLNGYEYIGPFVYSRDGENLTLSSADMSCGRFVRVPGQDGLVPEYWSMDYLGSVRARDTAGEVKFYDYTPYGSLWNTSLPSSGDNPHGFNGKEFQSFDSVNLYDYGARMYSPVIPMWTTPDPLFEKNHTVNPLSFCAGDPVNYIDPDGMAWFYCQSTGSFISQTDDDDDKIYLLNDDQVNKINEGKFDFLSKDAKQLSFSSAYYNKIISKEATDAICQDLFFKANKTTEGGTESIVPNEMKVEEIQGSTIACVSISRIKRGGNFVGAKAGMIRLDPSKIREGYAAMTAIAHEIGHILDVRSGNFHNRSEYGTNGYEAIADNYAMKSHWAFNKASAEAKRQVLLHYIMFSNGQR